MTSATASASLHSSEKIIPFHNCIFWSTALCLQNSDDNQLSDEDGVGNSIDKSREGHCERNCDDPRQRNVSHQRKV